MKFVIEYGTSADLDELEKLYDDLNDYLSATTNYPGDVYKRQIWNLMNLMIKTSMLYA